MDEKRLSYTALADRIYRLYSRVDHLKQEVLEKRNKYQQLSGSLQDWKIANPFPVLESDINGMIGQWQPDASFEQLSDKLAGYYTKISSVDHEIEKLKQHRQKLLQNPDRHNCKVVTEKINLFLQKVQTISLAQLDIITGDVIPKLNALISGVYGGFDDEETKVKKNQSAANELNKRISTYSGYVDRFNLWQLCEKCKKLSQTIINTPNKANPDSDSAALAKASQALDNCMNQFKAEDDRYRTLLNTMDDNKTDIWQDDYQQLSDVLEKGAYHDTTLSADLQAQYDALLGVKLREINQAMVKYSEKVKSLYDSQITQLKDGFYGRDALQRLVRAMDDKEAELKKQLIIKIVKYAAIVIAIVAAVVLVSMHPWVLLIPVALLIIVYFVYKD